MKVARTRHGFSLIEIVVVVGVIAAMTAMAVPRIDQWFANIRAKSAARSAADAFLLARAEASRTGNNHVVFFGPPGTTDPAGTVLANAAGEWAPLLILNDGPPATANCRIDAGEPFETVAPVDDVTFGASLAGAAVPSDDGAAAYGSGFTFTDPGNNPIRWVLFRPDGIPVAFTGAGGVCAAIAGLGSGVGGIYVTNGKLDYAVVLSPLGGVRVHVWRPGGSQWSS